jgi:hypothetical protein
MPLQYRKMDLSMFEQLLEPGCTESPACQGGEMNIAAIETLPHGSDAAIRIYSCDLVLLASLLFIVFAIVLTAIRLRLFSSTRISTGRLGSRV